MTNQERLRFGLLMIIGVFLLDQTTKLMALKNLYLNGESVSVMPCLNFMFTFNKGISFGLLANLPWLSPFIMAFVMIAIVIFLSVWFFKATNLMRTLALGMIIGGAIGNISDRFRFEGVIDFIDFYIGTYHWYTFNVADSAIVLGILVLILESVLLSKKEG